MASSLEETRPRFVLYLLILLTLAVFGRVLDFGFVSYDDDNYIYLNPHIQNGLTWKGIRWAAQADLVFDSVNADYWQPVTFLSRMVDIQLWKGRPAGHHLTNLLLHAANVTLLFLILLSLTRDLWKSAWAAGIFAVHPLVVDSVAWVTARKDVLSTFFGLLALASYVGWVRSPSMKRHLRTLFLFCLSLLSKPTFVVFPILLLLIDYWPLARLKSRKVFQEKWLLALVALGFSLLILRSPSRAVTSALQRSPVWVWPLFVLRYLGRAVRPVSLATLYPRTPPWNFWQITGGAGLFLALSIFFFLNRKRAPSLVTGWLWFLAALFPAVGSSGENRFMYLPLIGLTFFAWGIPRFFEKGRIGKSVLGLAAVLSLFVYGTGSWFALPRWRNSITLFQHDLRVSENNAPAHAALAHALEKQGRLNEAIRHYRRALRIDPAHLASHHGLGLALESQEKIDEAIAHYFAALKVNPGVAEIHNSLGVALTREKRFDEAVPFYRRALEINPDYAEAAGNLGAVMSLEGKFPEAVFYFEKALALNPEDLPTRLNLAKALKALKKESPRTSQSGSPTGAVSFPANGGKSSGRI